MMNLTKGETVVSLARLSAAELKQTEDALTVPLEVKLDDNGNGNGHGDGSENNGSGHEDESLDNDLDETLE